MSRRPPPRSAAIGTRGIALIAAAVLAAALAVVALRGRSEDPLPEMAGMPFAFITVEGAGYDAAKVILWRGGSTPPRSVQAEGATAWPAYLADASVVPLRDGKAWIFPMIEDAAGQHSSPLPPRGRTVDGRSIGFATPYLVPEAEAMLERFRAAHER